MCFVLKQCDIHQVKLFIMLGVIYDLHFRGLVIYYEIIIIRGG